MSSRPQSDGSTYFRRRRVLAGSNVVGVIGTEIGTAAGIEFSPFVGIPAGLVAGVVAAAVIFHRFEYPEPARRRPAAAIAGFGVAFVVVRLVAVGALRLRNSTVAITVAADSLHRGRHGSARRHRGPGIGTFYGDRGNLRR